MSDTKNVKLGVCQVFFGGADLGYTQGGVEVMVSTDTHKVNVDQFGKTTVDEIIMSRNCEIKVPLAETTLRNLVKIMPGASLVATGGVAATGKVTFSAAATANDVVTINGVPFTCKASPVLPNEFAPGATALASAQNLAAAVSNYPSPLTAVASYSAALNASNGELTVTYGEPGVIGNSFTLAKVGTAITVTGATLSGGTDATKMAVKVPTGISQSLLQTYAKKLVLHPKAKAATDKSEDFVVPLAATGGALQYAYMVDKERVFNCTFNGYPDPTTDVLFIVGDDTAS